MADLIGVGNGPKRTLAHWITSLRKLLRPLLLKYGAGSWLVWTGLDGVSFTLEALIIGVPFEAVEGAGSRLKAWRGSRQIRRVC